MNQMNGNTSTGYNKNKYLYNREIEAKLKSRQRGRAAG
jgi:hypothetical protein